MEPDAQSRRVYDEVERHHPVDEIEAHHRDRVLRFLATALRPMDRGVYDPGHITGSAFVVSADARQTLLVHHAKLGRWLQPGGHAEVGETDAWQVARREADEEVGIRIDAETGELFDLDVHEIPARGEQPAHLHFDLRYLIVVPQAEGRAGSEVLAARWFGLSEAEGVVGEAGLRRMIGKVRKRLAD